MSMIAVLGLGLVSRRDHEMALRYVLLIRIGKQNVEILYV